MFGLWLVHISTAVVLNIIIGCCICGVLVYWKIMNTFGNTAQTSFGLHGAVMSVCMVIVEHVLKGSSNFRKKSHRRRKISYVSFLQNFWGGNME